MNEEYGGGRVVGLVGHVNAVRVTDEQSVRDCPASGAARTLHEPRRPIAEVVAAPMTGRYQEAATLTSIEQFFELEAALAVAIAGAVGAGERG